MGYLFFIWAEGTPSPRRGATLMFRNDQTTLLTVLSGLAPVQMELVAPTIKLFSRLIARATNSISLAV